MARCHYTYPGSDRVVEVGPASVHEFAVDPAEHGRGVPELSDEESAETYLAYCQEQGLEPAATLPGQDEPETEPKLEGPEVPEDLSSLTVAELEDLGDGFGIDESDIEGTGSGGNVLKADWIAALEPHV